MTGGGDKMLKAQKAQQKEQTLADLEAQIRQGQGTMVGYSAGGVNSMVGTPALYGRGLGRIMETFEAKKHPHPSAPLWNLPKKAGGK